MSTIPRARPGVENCTIISQTRNKAAYGFTYDALDSLTKAQYGEYNSSNTWQSGSLNRYSVDPIGYDDNGTIAGITRKGWISGTTYNTIDQLAYSYSGAYGNQLASIAETSDASTWSPPTDLCSREEADADDHPPKCDRQLTQARQGSASSAGLCRAQAPQNHGALPAE